jgi:hypothetical protein
MLLIVEVRKDSGSIAVTEEMAKALMIGDGDMIIATRTASGYELSVHDPNRARKAEAAKRGMIKYREALIKLSE